MTTTTTNTTINNNNNNSKILGALELIKNGKGKFLKLILRMPKTSRDSADCIKE